MVYRHICIDATRSAAEKQHRRAAEFLCSELANGTRKLGQERSHNRRRALPRLCSHAAWLNNENNICVCIWYVVKRRGGLLICVGTVIEGIFDSRESGIWLAKDWRAAVSFRERWDVLSARDETLTDGRMVKWAFCTSMLMLHCTWGGTVTARVQWFDL